MEKVRRDPASLSQLVKDFDLEVVYKGLDYDTRMITCLLYTSDAADE